MLYGGVPFGATTLYAGVPVGTARQVDYLQLNQGDRVYFPEDLLAVVSPDSPSGRAAERSRSARSTAKTLAGVGSGFLVLGGGLMVVPIISSGPDDMKMTPFFIGGAAAALGFIAMFATMPFGQTANDEAATAFETYDSALRDSLQIATPAAAKP